MNFERTLGAKGGVCYMKRWLVVGEIVVIEGVYTLRQELADYFDLKVWVDCPRDKRLARGIERDGEGARDWWEKNWMVQEDSYVAAYKPFDKADLILSGEAEHLNERI